MPLAGNKKNFKVGTPPGVPFFGDKNRHGSPIQALSFHSAAYLWRTHRLTLSLRLL
jgi:hypothetical protein